MNVTRSFPVTVIATMLSDEKFCTSSPIFISPSYPLIVALTTSTNSTEELALSPLRVVIEALVGPVILRFSLAALPATVVSVSAVISITPPSSTPKFNVW